MSDTHIVEFLRARLDEDEGVARAAASPLVRVDSPGYWGDGPFDPEAARWSTGAHASDEQRIEDERCEVVVYDEGSPTTGQARHIARHDPARVLREVAAKRAILDEHAEAVAFYATNNAPAGEVTGLEFAIKALVSAYPDHPDYDPEWSTP